MNNGIAFQLLFAVIFSMNKVNAQYVPILKEGSEWAVHTTGLVWSNEYLTISNPELIEGELYYEVLGDNWGYYGDLLLREDSTEQKVYVSSPQFPNNEEYVLFDFSAEQGDTIMAYHGSSYPSPRPFIVDTIFQGFIEDLMPYSYPEFTTLVNPKIIRLIDENSWSIIFWIEGIGSSTGLLNLDDGHARLMCHFNSEGIKDYDLGYTYEGEECMGEFGGNVSDIKNEIKLNIFPNPSSDIFNFESNRIIKEITVFNNVGILLDHHQFNRFQTNLNLGHYPPSIYYCQILFDKGQKLHRRLVVE